MLGRFPALAGVDLDIDAGEAVLLAGANGAGKTTLLRLCAGLLPLRTGTGEVLGVDLTADRKAIRRAVALVGHETFCYDDLTVRENLRFAARACGRRVEDADAALERVGLQRVANIAHGRLSLSPAMISSNSILPGSTILAGASSTVMRTSAGEEVCPLLARAT